MNPNPTSYEKTVKKLTEVFGEEQKKNASTVIELINGETWK